MSVSQIRIPSETSETYRSEMHKTVNRPTVAERFPANTAARAGGSDLGCRPSRCELHTHEMRLKSNDRMEGPDACSERGLPHAISSTSDKSIVKRIKCPARFLRLTAAVVAALFSSLILRLSNNTASSLPSVNIRRQQAATEVLLQLLQQVPSHWQKYRFYFWRTRRQTCTDHAFRRGCYSVPAFDGMARVGSDMQHSVMSRQSKIITNFSSLQSPVILKASMEWAILQQHM